MLAVFFSVSSLWWLAAWIFPSPLNGDISPVREILALMGLLFLLCGAMISVRNQSPWASLFAIYTCSAAIHWAGPLGDNEGYQQLLLLAIYVLLGIALFASSFLHLALRFQSPPLDRGKLAIVYAPVLLTILLALTVLSGLVAEDAILLMFMAGSVYGFIAGLVWLYRLWISKSTSLQANQAVAVTVALLLAWIPNMLVQYKLIALGDYGGITNLTSLIMLAALCWIANFSEAESSHGVR